LFEVLERSTQGETYLIQHKSGNSILQDETQYQDLVDQIETLISINRGLQDCLDGKTLTHAEMKMHIRSHAKKLKK
jgi:hypothetical protein